MPFIGGGHHALIEDRRRAVLAALEFVADDRHLRCEILATNQTVDHPVGFETNGELEILIGGRQCLVVIGAVEPGCAIKIGPVVLQSLRNVGMVGSPLEKHVLQQVGHAGLAVPFMAGADEQSEVDRDLWLRRVFKQEDFQPVFEPILGDSLDRGDELGVSLGGR